MDHDDSPSFGDDVVSHHYPYFLTYGEKLRAADRLPEATAVFHRRLVELTGNTTLALIAAMLHEITEHHLAGTPKPTPTRSDYRRLVAAFQSLIDLLRSGDRDLAQAHWRAHLHTVGAGLRHRRFAGHRR